MPNIVSAIPSNSSSSELAEAAIFLIASLKGEYDKISWLRLLPAGKKKVDVHDTISHGIGLTISIGLEWISLSSKFSPASDEMYFCFSKSYFKRLVFQVKFFTSFMLIF